MRNTLLKQMSFLGILLAFPIMSFAQWVQNGVSLGGGIHAIAGGGRNVFLGNQAGLFQSTDNGINLSAINMGQTNNASVFSLVMQNRTIVAGSSEGVFRSTNTGTTWWLFRQIRQIIPI